MDTQVKPFVETSAYGEDEEMSQTDLHNSLVDYMASVIRSIFANQVMGVFKSINLCGDPLTPNVAKSPDLLVIDGLLQDIHHEYASYYISSDNAPPRFLLEVASDSTWASDVGHKVQVYQRMGVLEYFVADPHIEPVWTGNWRQQGRLIGWRLNPQTRLYERIEPDANGRLESQQLDSWLVMEGVDNRELHLYDQAGQLRLTEREAEHRQRLVELQQRLVAQAQANTAYQQRLAAEAQAEAERQQRLAAEAQAEAARLRAQELEELLRQFNQKPQDLA